MATGGTKRVPSAAKMDTCGYEDSVDAVVVIGVDSRGPHSPSVAVDWLVQLDEFPVQRFRVQGSGFRVQGFEFPAQRFRV